MRPIVVAQNSAAASNSTIASLEATARALRCSVHRMAQPVAFSFAEVTSTSSAANELASLFSRKFDLRLQKIRVVDRRRIR
jgi:hypothetical protein